jgi:hypothetical protein
MIELRRIQVFLSHENMKVRRSRHSWFILVLNLPADYELWCDFFCIPPNPGVSSIHPSFAMPRERGKPHRGSAWDTHAAQRQRRQHMEHALSMANSILRQRARFTCIALHATVTESAMKRRAHTPLAQDNWKPTDMKRVEIPAIEPETQVGSSLKEEPDEEFPNYYVEEIPCLNDIVTALEPQATDMKRRRLCEDIPNCYVEEIPYEDEGSKRSCVVMVHHTDIAAMDKDKAGA